MRRLNGTAAAFDRQFYIFLESARRALPPATAGVAILGAPASDAARYLATYHLAPLPVLVAPDRRPRGLGPRRLWTGAAARLENDRLHLEGRIDGARAVNGLWPSLAQVAAILLASAAAGYALAPRAPSRSRPRAERAAWGFALGLTLLALPLPPAFPPRPPAVWAIALFARSRPCGRLVRSSPAPLPRERDERGVDSPSTSSSPPSSSSA